MSLSRESPSVRLVCAALSFSFALSPICLSFALLAYSLTFYDLAGFVLNQEEKKKKFYLSCKSGVKLHVKMSKVVLFYPKIVFWVDLISFMLVYPRFFPMSTYIVSSNEIRAAY